MCIELFVFDLDGVLTETSEQHYLAWKMIADELGIPFDKKRNELLKGISRMESLEILLQNASRNFSDDEKAILATNKNMYYKHLINDFSPANLFHGVIELLDDLKRQQIKIALASASYNAPLLIEKLGIKTYFDVVVDPGTIRYGKPNPEIFLEAAYLLNVNPINCIGVEDAIAGVTAIKSAGMYAIGIGEPDTLENADIVYASVSELNYQNIKSLVKISKY